MHFPFKETNCFNKISELSVHVLGLLVNVCFKEKGLYCCKKCLLLLFFAPVFFILSKQYIGQNFRANILDA